MSLETRKVLDMLTEGKISAADAEKLLEKLQASSATADETQTSAPGDVRAKAKFLRIQVEEPGRKPVNIRVPLAFARAGKSLIGILPLGLTDKLKERGLDLEQLRFHTGFGKDENVELLKQLDIDIDKGDGKKVRIFCE